MLDFFDILDKMSKIDEESDNTFDITTKQGLQDFDDYIYRLDDYTVSLLEAFKSFLGIDKDVDVIDGLSELAHDVYNAANPKKEVERKVVDHTELEEKDDRKTFNRPSENLNVDQKLQLHKLVQEYVDTMIKPFNNGQLKDSQINDAYAGLFEFAAWVLNK